MDNSQLLIDAYHAILKVRESCTFGFEDYNVIQKASDIILFNLSPANQLKAITGSEQIEELGLKILSAIILKDTQK